MFGASAAGGVFVPVNPLLRPQQVGYILDDCGVRVLVTSPERLELLARRARATARRSSTSSSSATPGEPAPERDYARPRLGRRPAAAPSPRRDADAIDVDMAAILYTSGSTGKPKGVVLSHRNLIVGAESVSQYLGNTRGRRASWPRCRSASTPASAS